MKVTPAGFKDLPKIYNLELRSYEYPIEHTALQQILEMPKMIPFIGTLQGLGVGWLLGVHHQEDLSMEVNRLCVHPAYRCQGRGRILVGHLWNEAVKRNCKTIFFMVPEYQLDQNDPDCVLPFLEKLEFKATTIETDYFWRYGRPYDGIKWERNT